ncbi:HU family DNA-binding protein [Capnocytophaga sp. Marseille-Q4570]|jgi:histone family protein DNA-binding protein|uniref:HU family DNA-binding protein n=1 Tax=Capnocytophaga bilenii TaxID=2819369 RepID=A0ABS3PZQ0_9FLAO|nr:MULTISPECIES: HU family DNA-binding protein [Capnocytophaga]EKY07127.1 putative DNA-binding protein HU-beta [Capnocytophaga sp. oral taxon 332 str. F0381]MBO1884816.1 HU family DNA-binding protein [Capnocytophaga bilenii]
MNKTELIDAIAVASGVSKADTKKAVEAFFSTVEDALKKGDKVSIVGFGSWQVADKEAREARNPRTGEVIKVPAKKVVKFKAGAELADAVNN